MQFQKIIFTILCFCFLSTTDAFCHWTTDQCQSKCTGGLLGKCDKTDRWNDCYKYCNTRELLQAIVSCAQLAYKKGIMTQAQCRVLKGQSQNYDFITSCKQLPNTDSN